MVQKSYFLMSIGRTVGIFSGNDQNYFSFKDIIEKYPDTDKIYLSKVLSKMIEKGMVIKLSRSIYHIVPCSADSSSYQKESGKKLNQTWQESMVISTKPYK